MRVSGWGRVGVGVSVSIGFCVRIGVRAVGVSARISFGVRFGVNVGVRAVCEDEGDVDRFTCPDAKPAYRG